VSLRFESIRPMFKQSNMVRQKTTLAYTAPKHKVGRLRYHGNQTKQIHYLQNNTQFLTTTEKCQETFATAYVQADAHKIPAFTLARRHTRPTLLVAAHKYMHAPETPQKHTHTNTLNFNSTHTRTRTHPNSKRTANNTPANTHVHSHCYPEAPQGHADTHTHAHTHTHAQTK
jgi:hypothetical protein